MNQQESFKNTNQEEEGIDLKKFSSLILSSWWWFAISIFLGLTTAYLINRYSQKTYRSTCTVIVGEEKRSGSIDDILDELSKVRNKRRKAVVENEISILKSYKLARTAIEELDFQITYSIKGRRGIAINQIYHDSPFNVILTDGEYNRTNYPIDIVILGNNKYNLRINDEYAIDIEYEFGKKFEHNDFNFTIVLKDPENGSTLRNESNKYSFIIHDINSLALSYQKKLSVEVNDEKGSILALKLQGFVPNQLSDYLNKLSEIYIRYNLEERNRTATNTIDFIDSQLEGVIDSLEATSIRLQNFRSEHRVIDLTTEGKFLIDQLDQLHNEKALLEINERYFKYLLSYIQKKDEFTDIIAPSVVGIQDDLLNNLVLKLNELNSEKRNLSFSLNDKSPQTVFITQEINKSKKIIEENIKSLLESNKISLIDYNGRLALLEEQIKKLPKTERQLINIQREFNVNDQIYTFLLEKRAEAGITRASNTADHAILDVARPENAELVKPDRIMNFLMGIIFGMAIPGVIIILVEQINTRITDRRFLEKNLIPPVLGYIGHGTTDSELQVYENPNSSITESFRTLRTNLQFIMKDSSKKIIAVSSAISGEGKTFCSINLSCILAMAGKKTLLVNLDLRRPRIHKIFNLNNQIGISTYLINESSFDEVITNSNINNLFITTSGPIPPNPAELIDSNKMHEFISKARLEFDNIILDTPPIAIVSDTLAINSIIDSFLFVVRHNYSSKQVIEIANSLAKNKRIENIGVLVNDITLKGYYGYSYKTRYGYSYNYQNYYHEDTLKKGIFRRIFGK